MAVPSPIRRAELIPAAILLSTLIPLGCTQTTTTTPATATTPAVTTTTTTGPFTNLATFAQVDLANAIAIATKAGPAGAPIVSCFTFLQTNLAQLQTDTTPPSGTVGAATAFTIADLALGNANAALSPSSQTAYAMACGPLIVQTMNQGMSLSSQVAALAAMVAK